MLLNTELVNLACLVRNVIYSKLYNTFNCYHSKCKKSFQGHDSLFDAHPPKHI